MEEKKFDIVVLGGGPGGYPAAIKAAQMGQSVALIEAKELGGTCLNRGCIPTKALIANGEILHKIKAASEYGIEVGSFSFDYEKMIKRKDKVVESVRKGLEGLIASNQIHLIKGFGKFTSPDTIKVIGQDNAVVQGKKMIIATGSEPRNISAFPFDYKRIHDSTSLLELTTLPRSIAIVGGGIIGCEFASLFNILGVEVTVLEMLPRLLPTESSNVSDFISKVFQKKGIKIHTNAKVEGIDKKENELQVRLENGTFVPSEIALVAVGRSLNTSGIGLENAGVLVDPSGIIPVNDKMETNVPGIYAIGDIASKWWLAHVATHQGLVAASNAAGKEAHMHYNAVPSVIFTEPEIATVGLNLEQALEKGYLAVSGAFPFQALGKAKAAIQTEGFAQVVTDKRTGQILGAQVVGYEASILISEMAVAVANELTLESIADTIHAHPTMPEAWLEAVLMAHDTPIHLPPKKRKS